MQICELIIFTRKKELKLEREKKYGGDIVFNDYSELEKQYSKGDVHPKDLKNAVSKSLIKILEPVRKKFSSEKVKKLKQAVTKN